MNKNTSYRSSQLLRGLLRERKDFFRFAEAARLMPELREGTLRELLSAMARRGLILRLRDGLYNIIPFERDSETYFPDWHRTASAMVNNEDYYIGYYSAMHLHGLITQPSLVEQVVTHKQIKPARQMVGNVRFQFITHNAELFFGYKKFWIDEYHKVNVSNLEKTIIDCLYRPSYGGGITEITKAIFRKRTELDPGRMQDYLLKFPVQAVYKRMGILLDALELFPQLQDFIKYHITQAYTQMDPSIPQDGHHNSYWRVVENVDIDAAVRSIST